MARASLSARTAATAATANAVAAVLWNPHATIRVRVYQIDWCKTVATADFQGLMRVSARGTVTTSAAATLGNETDQAVTPPSGATIDTAWSTAPTLLASMTAPMWRWNLPAAAGSGFMSPWPEELEVGPGTGLAIVTPVATILQPADVGFRWAE